MLRSVPYWLSADDVQHIYCKHWPTDSAQQLSGELVYVFSVICNTL